MNEHALTILFFKYLTISPLQGGVLTALTIVILSGWFYFRRRIKKLKNEKAELWQLVNERSELLTYSVEREKKSRDNAAQANRAKSLLIARINHEIRTPLNGILGMVSLMNETALTNEQKDYSHTIRECGESLLQVVNDIMFNDILSYSKLESGKMELEQNDFDLSLSIEEVLDAFAVKAAERGTELIYQSGPGVPASISGDALRFRQVLTNLIENSITRTKEGEIFVCTKLTGANTANTLEVEFEIYDTGAYIETESLTSPSGNGNRNSTIDPGLSIAKKLIDLMGGSLTMERLQEKGNKIKFTIQARTSLALVRPAGIATLAGIEGKKVLIVQKNEHLAGTLQKLLEHWKLMPVVAASEMQALEQLAKQDDIALIITDLNLVKTDAIEFTQRVKQQHATLPVILMAPAGNVNGKEHPHLFTSVIFKPVKRDLLGKQILGALLHKEQRGTKNQSDVYKLSADFATLHPLRILIAEDNLTNQKLAMKVLSKLGYKPDVAQHGKEVLEIVSHKNYDVILMDVQMPFMDGLEASRMIRLCLSTQPVIIAMTANTLQGDRDECMRAGMDDYISKPVNLEELVNILEKWAYQIKEKQQPANNN